MKAITQTIAASLLICCTYVAHAQIATTFTKGSLLIGVTEGATFTHYTTVVPSWVNPGGTGDNVDAIKNDGNVNGDRDPLCIEYGISNHWGVGISMGGDVLKPRTDQYYNFKATGKTTMITSEITADLNYHFYNTKKTDLSAFLSMGLASMMLKSENEEHTYKYEATGSIARIGGRVRYYFTRRLGIMGMASVYTSSMSSSGVKTNNVAQGYDTYIRGWAIEFGPCVRLLR